MPQQPIVANGISRKSHQQWVVVAACAFLGWAILKTHLFYLDHPGSLQWHGLMPSAGLLHVIKALIFAVWLITVAAGCYGIRKRSSQLRINYRMWLAWSVFCATVVPYNPLDFDPSFYFIINSIGYALIIYALVHLPHSEAFLIKTGKIFAWIFQLPGTYFCALAFGSIFYFAYTLSGIIFQHIPAIDDTIAQYVHAKFLLTGNWYGMSPPLREFFPMQMMIDDGKWYSQYSPGHVMFLALGHALSHPEMVNPALGGLSGIAVYLLAKELYGGYVAKIAALLVAGCVYIIVLSSEYMNNATSLLMGTLFLWGYFRVLHRHQCSDALISGAALGFCFITRPYTALALALPAALYGVYLLLAQPRDYRKPMLLLAGAVLVFIVFQLHYNSLTTGDPFVFGYQRVHGNRPNPFTPEAYARLDVGRLYRNLRANFQRASSFNRFMFEWPIPGLSLVALLFSVRGHRRDERLLFMTLFSMFVSVQFTNNLEFGWGPRLVYEISGIIIVISAKALSILPALLRTLWPRYRTLSFYYGGFIVIMASFYAFSFAYSMRIDTIRNLYRLNAREGNPGYYYYLANHVTTPALVFVSFDNYKYVAFTNPPQQDSPIIFASDSHSHDLDLMRYYPDRNIYRVVGRNIRKIQ